MSNNTLLSKDKPKPKISHYANTKFFGIANLGNVPALVPQKAQIRSFSETFSKYNEDLTEEEIKAWVWFKRSVGNPMKGWERYYISGTGSQEVAVATKLTMVKDNRWIDLKEMPKGAILGKPTKFVHEKESGEYWQMLTSPEGNKIIAKKSDFELKKVAEQANDEALDYLVNKGALFYSDGDLLPIAIFTFGDIYDKLDNLERDKETIIAKYGQNIYDLHLETLNAAKPKALHLNNPSAKERPIIQAISKTAQEFRITTIKPEYMEDVAESVEVKKKFDKESGQTQRVEVNKKKRIKLKFDSDQEYSLIEVFAKYLYSLQPSDFKKVLAVDIVQYYLENAPIVSKEMTDAQKRELKANAREEGEYHFQKFLHEVLEYEDQLRLDNIFNRSFNSFAKIQFNKVPIGFQSSEYFKNRKFEISLTQREAIAFSEITGSGILAFDVGVGKTVSAIITLANAMQSGKCSRPFIVVPNAVYAKWKKELFGVQNPDGTYLEYGVFSGLGYTLNDWHNLGRNIVELKNNKFYINGHDLTKKVPANSITMLTYEGFEKIGFGAKVEEELIKSLGKIYLNRSIGIDEAKQAAEDAKSEKKEKSARDEEKENQRIMSKIGGALIDTVLDIDAVGLDYMVFDELHNAKNVFESVSSHQDRNEQDKGRYALTSAISGRGIKAFFISNYIQRTFGGNVLGLTATPFTNSPLEIFSMLMLVGYDILKANNLEYIKDFFDMFVLPSQEYVVNVEGKIETKPIVKSFLNRIPLQRLINNKIFYKTGEEANVPRPCKINLPKLYSKGLNGELQRLPKSEAIHTYLEMNEMQKYLQMQIVSRIVGARSMMKKKDAFGAGKAEMFKAMSDSLNNAFSPFLYATLNINAFGKDIEETETASMSGITPEMENKLTKFIQSFASRKSLGDAKPNISKLDNENWEKFSKKISQTKFNYKTFVEWSPKIHFACECAKSLREYHINKKQHISGQVFYSNRGIEFFKYIKEWLHKEAGFAEKVRFYKEDEEGDVVYDTFISEVEIVQSKLTNEKREMIKEAFLAGICKVIIGSQTISEGVDLQTYGTVIYDLYPEYTPTRIKQLEGRIHRQGNKYQFVRFVMPLVKDSMDLFVFQKLEEKTARINELWESAERGNVLDVESLDPAEIKMALMTDVSQIAQLLIEEQKIKVEKQIDTIQNVLNEISTFDATLRNYQALRQTMIDNIKDTIFYKSSNFNELVLDKLNGYHHEYRILKIQKQNYYDRLEEIERKFAKDEEKLLSEKKTLNSTIKVKDIEKKIEKIETDSFAFLSAINEWANSGGKNGKELLLIFRKNIYKEVWEKFFTNWSWVKVYSDYKEYLSKTLKGEKIFLKPKGKTLDDNLLDVIEVYKKDLAEAKAELKLVNSEDYFETKKKFVENEKLKYAFGDETVAERVKAFAKLNYLVDYAYSPHYDCSIIPSKGLDNETQSTDKQKVLAKLKLSKLKLKLLKLTIK